MVDGTDILLLRDQMAGLGETRAELRQVLGRFLDVGPTSFLEEVPAFEQALARWLGVTFALALSSGPTALELILRALGLGPGDGVLVDGFANGLAQAAFARLGARAIPVDVEADLPSMDPRALETTLASGRARGAKAILVHHRAGHAADLVALGALARAHGLPLIEDASDAVGAALDGRRLGTLGTVGLFCLGVERTFSALGGGGVAVTTDPDLAARIRTLAQVYRVPMDPARAAVAQVRMRVLESEILRRQAVALRYDTALRGLGLRVPVERWTSTHVYDAYLARPTEGGPEIGDCRAALDRVGLEAAGLRPLAPAPSLAEADRDVAPRVRAWCAGTIALPIYARLPTGIQRRVIEALMGVKPT
jgi:dTDP-4-amino-4,6-dideoxygalactose transaminase